MTEADELLAECRQRQDDELLALQSIYPAADEKAVDSIDAQFTLVSTDPEAIIELLLPIVLPHPTRVVIDCQTSDSEPNSVHTKSGLNADASAFSPYNVDDVNQSPGQPVKQPNKPARIQQRANLRLEQDCKHVSQPGRPRCDTQLPPSIKTKVSSTRVKTTILPPLLHLAPLKMRLRLPSTYPAEHPPFVEDLQAVWLPSRDSDVGRWLLDELQAQYDAMGGLEILWTWADWLSEGLWRDALSVGGNSNLPPFVVRASTELQLRFDEHIASGQEPLLPSQLLLHSRLCTRTTFDSSSFACGICLETRKGKACARLAGCGHVFCSDCLTSYLSMLVDEGFHRQARRCPDPDCVKMWGEQEKLGEIGDIAATDGTPVRGLITQTELESVLTAAQLQRLDSLSIKARMEADPSLSYCPREGCQSAVVRSSSDEGSGHWERFRECHKCSFAFCAWCSRSWHGPTPCPVSFQAGLIKQYLALDPESPAYLQMQKKFGKKTLDTLVKNYLEEQETKQWLQDYTTPCPTCGISIEKSYGCNHMTCKSCLTHYCYLCGKTISGTNPYSHFNTAGYECYNRLFDGLLGAQNPQAAFPVGPDGIPINAEDLIPWEELI